MSKICDRSPCDRLLKSLGTFIFGAPDREGGFYLTIVDVTASGSPTEVNIEYCPFCGTRLEEVPSVVVEKFMRPRRRRKTERPNS
jgi:hypothetical protein